ncbi:hypothetical protein GGG16DRAFT_29255, partial [Schizophyllum commune]
SLSALSDNTGTRSTPDCWQSFSVHAKQYRHSTLLKQEGHGHNDSGVDGTKPGELVLPYFACPHPGINLPTNWCDIDPELRQVVARTVKADTNFCMRNHSISNKQRDPILGDGWGYMVKKDKYYDFLKRFIAISSCSSFAALVLANLKRSKGLRLTGIGSVCCACHNMWRAQGMGKLQKEERYSNMTFILFSALLAVNIMTIVLSYDIAC